VGAALRTVLLDPGTQLSDRAEALLMAADRAQHVASVIRPALDAGRHVVTDRYIGSTLAYQGYGRGLVVGDLRCLSHWAAQGLWPDVVVLLDVPLEVACGRQPSTLDRFEAEGAEFHRRVTEGFRSLAKDDPERWAIVDGTPDPDSVEKAVWAAVVERCPELAARN
jgi:dTMP kinase